MPLFSKSSASANPPAKNVVFLPDHLFFTRCIPVDPAAGSVAAQVELALEGISPFPVAQLYYGYFTTPKSSQVLIFAAYRRRFTVDQTSEWAGADSVLPTFAAYLGYQPSQATALLITTDTGMTVMAWNGTEPVPVVTSRYLPPEADDEAKAALRTRILQEASVPAAMEAGLAVGEGADGDSVVFKGGPITSLFSVAELDALDVRDKGEIAARQRERGRNLIFWRIFVGLAAMLALSLLGEIVLVGGQLWQKKRVALTAKQAPAVQKIEQAQSLANRIEELSARRLMPFEMLTLVNDKRPKSIQFTRTTTTGMSTIEIEAKTLDSSSRDIGEFIKLLADSPFCQTAVTNDLNSRNGFTIFKLVVTFKPDALRKPAQS